MSKQTSLSIFFKQPSTSNSSSAIVNGPDLDVSENELRPPLKKVKLTTTILNYDESYVEYGFTYLHENNIDLPQCIICSMFLANAFLKPNKLLRHLEKNYVHYKNRNKDFFFKENYTSLKKIKKNIKSFTTEDKKYLK